VPDRNTALYPRTAKVAWTDMGRCIINAFCGALRPRSCYRGRSDETSGAVSKIETVRAWTLGDFKGIAERASKFASTYVF
jgi:hypothetical protein